MSENIEAEIFTPFVSGKNSSGNNDKALFVSGGFHDPFYSHIHTPSSSQKLRKFKTLENSE